MKKLFGTDGVRGRANHPPMTVETALALGRAAGKVFRTHSGKHRVVIGKDTRLSCYMFENALIAGLCSMGVDTLMVGPLATPGVAFITRAYRADAGIVISASHNPYHDNGIKFFSSEGYKLPDSMEKEIEAIIEASDFEDSLPPDHLIGKNTKVLDADGRYIEFVKTTFPINLSLSGLNIVLDCANGAGYRVAPHVFRELDAKVHLYGCEPNGLNINEGVGALHPSNVQKAVIDHQADVGIALDGDADR
ncbi:MAG: phosphoglucosamine mutase, partial [Chlamydiia bacterium]|nr:phosphoglucosamine mutase [Chlamydiia bacterium]